MKINTRLDLLEKEIEKIKYRFGYNGIATEDKNGVIWFTDRHGKKIRKDQADKDLIPEVLLILPEKLGL